MFIVTDILSLLPSWGSVAADPPKVGDKAPSLEKLTFPLDVSTYYDFMKERV